MIDRFTRPIDESDTHVFMLLARSVGFTKYTVARKVRVERLTHTQAVLEDGRRVRREDARIIGQHASAYPVTDANEREAARLETGYEMASKVGKMAAIVSNLNFNEVKEWPLSRLRDVYEAVLAAEAER